VDASEKSSCAHDGEVVGIACDSTNTLMISGGYHGDIKVDIILICLLISLEPNKAACLQAIPTMTFMSNHLMPKLNFLCCCSLCDEYAGLVLWIFPFLYKAEEY